MLAISEQLLRIPNEEAATKGVLTAGFQLSAAGLFKYV